MFALVLSEKPRCRAWSAGTGHMILPCTGGHARDTVRQCQHQRLCHITLSICASCNVFPKRQGRKRYGYNDISVLSTSSLLFSVKCQLLLYSGGDYKCQET